MINVIDSRRFLQEFVEALERVAFEISDTKE